MTPITTEIARAESLHGPLPLHIEPSHTLINAAAYMESIARTEDPMSALAILCEEVGEVARAAPEDLPAELAQVIAVAVRWRRALGCVDDLQEAYLTLAAEQGRQEGAPSEGWVYVDGYFERWEKGKAVVQSLDCEWVWRVGRRKFRRAPTARAAMKAVDAEQGKP